MTNATEACRIAEIKVFLAHCDICDEETTKYPAPTPEHASRAFMAHWQQEHNEDGSYKHTCPECGSRTVSGNGGGLRCVSCGWWFCY